MKHRMVRIVVFSCILLGAFGSAFAQTKLPRFIEIGTAGTGGAYYPIGIAMAEILTQKLKIQATAQVTGGAVENIRLIQEGSVKIALTTTANAYRGLKGLPPFTKPSPKVAGLFSNLTQGVYQIAVRENAGIKTLQDLKGKRVSVGAAKSGTELNARAIMQGAGMSYKDLGKVEYLPFNESVELMKNRQLDATLISAGLGVSAIRDLCASVECVIVEIPKAVVEKIGAPYQSATVPGGSETPSARTTTTPTVDVDVCIVLLGAGLLDVNGSVTVANLADLIAAALGANLTIDASVLAQVFVGGCATPIPTATTTIPSGTETPSATVTASATNTATIPGGTETPSATTPSTATATVPGGSETPSATVTTTATTTTTATVPTGTETPGATTTPTDPGSTTTPVATTTTTPDDPNGTETPVVIPTIPGGDGTDDGSNPSSQGAAVSAQNVATPTAGAGSLPVTGSGMQANTDHLSALIELLSALSLIAALAALAMRRPSGPMPPVKRVGRLMSRQSLPLPRTSTRRDIHEGRAVPAHRSRPRGLHWE